VAAPRSSNTQISLRHFQHHRWHSTRDNADSDHEEATSSNNLALQGVIQQGIKDLKTTTNLIQNKKETKKPLFHKAALEETGPTPKQLAEANRVLTVAAKCLEDLQNRKKANDMLSIGGHSIILLHVDVNANLREATVYWALPFEILLEVGDKTREELTKKMQARIVEGGGRKFLQREVHSRLGRSYYPPKLKFEPASDVLLQQMLELEF
jgi:hypothetical protein